MPERRGLRHPGRGPRSDRALAPRPQPRPAATAGAGDQLSPPRVLTMTAGPAGGGQGPSEPVQSSSSTISGRGFPRKRWKTSAFYQPAVTPVTGADDVRMAEQGRHKRRAAGAAIARASRRRRSGTRGGRGAWTAAGRRRHAGRQRPLGHRAARRLPPAPVSRSGPSAGSLRSARHKRFIQRERHPSSSLRPSERTRLRRPWVTAGGRERPNR